MIIKEVIGTGRTVSEAQENAVALLNAGIDEDVQFEIITDYKKKVLGIFGGSEAKVKAFVEGPDPEPKKEKPVKHGTCQKKNDCASKPAKSVQKYQATASENVEKEEKTESIGIPAKDIDADSQAGRAYKYLTEVLARLGCEEIDATISEIEGGSKITLKGNDKLGVIIGRRGETLDALQYLASLVANENGGGYYRVVIDIGNYRERREATLEALAKRTAGQVLRTGRSRSLEPMNPYERRVIHTAVQNIEGVSSTSVGDGVARRVVIIPEGKQVRLPDDHRSSRGNRDRRSGQNRQNRQAKPLTEATAFAKPKETDGTKLYGKLK